MTTRHADPALLDDLARGSLGWLNGARDSFRLPPDVTTDADPDLTLKPLGELAELTQLIGVLHPLDDIRRAAQELFAYAWNDVISRPELPFGRSAVSMSNSSPAAVRKVSQWMSLRTKAP